MPGSAFYFAHKDVFVLWMSGAASTLEPSVVLRKKISSMLIIRRLFCAMQGRKRSRTPNSAEPAQGQDCRQRAAKRGRKLGGGASRRRSRERSGEEAAAKRKRSDEGPKPTTTMEEDLALVCSGSASASLRTLVSYTYPFAFRAW